MYENQEEKGRWIPISERLPEDESYILVSFENATMPDIARYEEMMKAVHSIREMMKILFELWNICQCMDAIAETIQGRR